MQDERMINQTTTLHRVRMPMVAIAAFALGALASAALPQLHLVGASTPAPIVISQTPAIHAQPLVTVKPQSTTNCDRGAYVTGDMVGDASPATVYATMCGR